MHLERGFQSFHSDFLIHRVQNVLAMKILARSLFRSEYMRWYLDFLFRVATQIDNHHRLKLSDDVNEQFQKRIMSAAMVA